MICEHCHGKRLDPNSPVPVPCPECQGAGVVCGDGERAQPDAPPDRKRRLRQRERVKASRGELSAVRQS